MGWVRAQPDLLLQEEGAQCMGALLLLLLLEAAPCMQKVQSSHQLGAGRGVLGVLQQQQGPAALNGESRRPGPVLEQPEFQTLCQAIISGCSKFDNFSIVNCLYAAAALGEWPGHGAALRASCGERRVRCRGRA